MLPLKQVAMLEYLEAQVITSTLLKTLLQKMLATKSAITDGSQLMAAPMKPLKAKIMKKASTKYIDGLMKTKDPMKQTTGLILWATSINATDGSMT